MLGVRGVRLQERGDREGRCALLAKGKDCEEWQRSACSPTLELEKYTKLSRMMEYCCEMTMTLKNLSGRSGRNV